MQTGKKEEEEEEDFFADDPNAEKIIAEKELERVKNQFTNMGYR